MTDPHRHKVWTSIGHLHFAVFDVFTFLFALGTLVNLLSRQEHIWI